MYDQRCLKGFYTTKTLIPTFDTIFFITKYPFRIRIHIFKRLYFTKRKRVLNSSLRLRNGMANLMILNLSLKYILFRNIKQYLIILGFGIKRRILDR